MGVMVSLRYPTCWFSIGWALLFSSVVVSLMPAQALHAISAINDKVEHSGGYALLTMWFTGIYPRSRYGLIALGLFVLGVAIEFGQGAMHLGRTRDVFDVVANSVGIAAGLTLALLWSGN